ncbi:hypothetical protein FA95DRAFT_1357623 [Auriscalpium vulgare]|uniref:Uncharacterized protein n=1 Tax=Auriscalpium vulgare TaxID=40419 RepID=A0ACB8R1N9_9AGAM|nr:hypothetical protein FA95DRAFT_1357623 [Auriscalpium vulgare]
MPGLDSARRYFYGARRAVPGKSSAQRAGVHGAQSILQNTHRVPMQPRRASPARNSIRRAVCSQPRTRRRVASELAAQPLASPTSNVETATRRCVAFCMPGPHRSSNQFPDYPAAITMRGTP